MGSNIIELAKLGHERAAELKGSYEAINACSVVKPDGKEMSVNRYEFEDYGTNEPDGRYVTYEDYSASEARCAALSAKLRMINDLTEAAEQANKLAQEAVETLVQERNALAAENSALKKSEAEFNEYCRRECEDVGDTWVDDFTETPATDAFLAEVRAQAHKEGAHFVANRMLAAWDAGFIDDTAKNAADIARMILTSTEFMADAPEGDFDRLFADGVLEGIAAQLRKGVAQ
ncbi:Eae-like protein [Salmonella enterica]|uniref:Eae-like protein n=1 Tax=Salmonella enterica TaxID=28901 RepID=A0A633LC51_SALER|nr:Eae-like protein [Salmonella enterica]EBY1463869.1 Eae-like protein [Salmonella enterica subsp. enterica serovar Newington]EDH2825899.1 Eae-like protein [Salmonella enterica]EKY5313454.1 Eae-like protein [Salmonella enterica]ELG3501846.1 Eae-like protein [Salmonella enterica]